MPCGSSPLLSQAGTQAGEKKPSPQNGQHCLWDGCLALVGRSGPGHAPPGAEGIRASQAVRPAGLLRGAGRNTGRPTGRPTAATCARGRAGDTSGPTQQWFLRLCVHGWGHERTLQLGMCNQVWGSLRAWGVRGPAGSPQLRFVRRDRGGSDGPHLCDGSTCGDSVLGVHL